MSDLLKKAIWFEENKDKLSIEDREIIRKDFLSQCKSKASHFSKLFSEAIDKING